MDKIFKQIPRILFGKNCIERIEELIPASSRTNILFIIDDVLPYLPIRNFINDNDVRYYPASQGEPSTEQVDQITLDVVRGGKIPEVIVGIGGGSTLDIVKAVSVMLTNPGKSQDYQGWDLVKNTAIFKIGVPTLSGSGAEASRTAVLIGPDKKFGINSDFSMLDAIILDSTLSETATQEQKFFTAMDCYIHCVESLTGTFLNALSQNYAEKALDLCSQSFLGDYNADNMMVASYMGGASIVNSEVGICHALSYGLSLELKFRHGFANCIIFKQLEEFYEPHVTTFKRMLDRDNIELPENIIRDLDEACLNRMTEMTLKMEKPLTNALGHDWRNVMTPSKIKELYMRL